MKQLLLISLIGSVGLLAAADRGKDIVSRPNEPIAKAAIMKLTGDWEDAKLSRDIRILWLSGPEDHKGGELELYDHTTPQGETKNLADTQPEKAAALLKQLRARLPQ